MSGLFKGTKGTYYKRFILQAISANSSYFRKGQEIYFSGQIRSPISTRILETLGAALYTVQTLALCLLQKICYGIRVLTGPSNVVKFCLYRRLSKRITFVFYLKITINLKVRA